MMKRVNVVIVLIVALLLAISVTGCGDDIENAYLLVNGGELSTDSTLQGSVVIPGQEQTDTPKSENPEEQAPTKTDEDTLQTGTSSVEQPQQPIVPEDVDIDVLEYFKDTLFIGDSRTAGLRQFGYFETAD